MIRPGIFPAQKRLHLGVIDDNQTLKHGDLAIVSGATTIDGQDYFLLKKPFNYDDPTIENLTSLYEELYSDFVWVVNPTDNDEELTTGYVQYAYATGEDIYRKRLSDFFVRSDGGTFSRWDTSELPQWLIDFLSSNISFKTDLSVSVNRDITIQCWVYKTVPTLDGTTDWWNDQSRIFGYDSDNKTYYCTARTYLSTGDTGDAPTANNSYSVQWPVIANISDSEASLFLTWFPYLGLPNTRAQYGCAGTDNSRGVAIDARVGYAVNKSGELIFGVFGDTRYLSVRSGQLYGIISGGFGYDETLKTPLRDADIQDYLYSGSQTVASERTYWTNIADIIETQFNNHGFTDNDGYTVTASKRLPYGYIDENDVLFGTQYSNGTIPYYANFGFDFSSSNPNSQPGIGTADMDSFYDFIKDCALANTPHKLSLPVKVVRDTAMNNTEYIQTTTYYWETYDSYLGGFSLRKRIIE